MLLALLGGLEGHLQDALNLRTRIDVGIVSLVIVLIFLSEIHSTRQFTDDYEVSTLQQFVLQGTLVQQTVESSHRTHVGKKAELLTHSQQALLWTNLCRRIIVILQVANGSKQHRIGTHADFVSGIGIGIANLINGMGTDNGFLVSKLVTELCCDSIEHSHTLFHNFRTYTVARKNGNFQFHNLIILGT